MSIRREVRLRKEFLFKAQQTAQAAAKTNKKRLLQEALDEGIFPLLVLDDWLHILRLLSGKSIPTEIKADAHKLQHEAEMDVYTGGMAAPPGLDDEFANVGSREPKVCVTTSRDPSSRLKQFAKYLKVPYRMCFFEKYFDMFELSLRVAPHFINQGG